MPVNIRYLPRWPLLTLISLMISACSWQDPAPVRAGGATQVAQPHSAHKTARIGQQEGLRSPGQIAATRALAQLGVAYQFGGNGPTAFDCSGLVQFAWRSAGFELPRTTARMWRTLQPVPASQRQVGDVLFFNVDGKPAHVGLYLGDGRFVHAPATGRVVEIESLAKPWYQSRLIRVSRPTGESR
ncbi:MAG: C40 family peptidase [Pseudomonadota bacterium]